MLVNQVTTLYLSYYTPSAVILTATASTNKK